MAKPPAFGGKQAPPFGQKADSSASASGDAPAFAKKAKKKAFGKKGNRKFGKVAPAQKSLMSGGGRSMSR